MGDETVLVARSRQLARDGAVIALRHPNQPTKSIKPGILQPAEGCIIGLLAYYNLFDKIWVTATGGCDSWFWSW